MLKFLKNYFVSKKYSSGALDDPRPQTEKDKDYKAEEVASFPLIQWVEKKSNEWRKFPIFNQDGSSSCVAQATAKLLGVENFLEENAFVQFSARDIYTRRSNEGGGMYFQEALQIACDYGATLETLMPSQELSETLMNISARKLSDEQIAKIFKGGGYVQLPFDIDKIASVISSGKSVLLGFRFNGDEWGSVPEIKTDKPELHHGVAGTDFCLYNGKKSVIIDDSWGSVGFNGQRVITDDFLKQRCTFAGYLLDLSNNWRDKEIVKVKPKYTFSVPLEYGQKNHFIVKLQEILKYEELFPQNVESTGYYGVITSKGVLAFQRKYNVADEDELTSLNGRRVGSKTISKLNELYSG